MKVKYLFAWYDLWIGLYWDRKSKALYFLPLPCIGLVLQFKVKEKCEHNWENVIEDWQDRYYVDRCKSCGEERDGEL